MSSPTPTPEKRASEKPNEPEHIEQVEDAESGSASFKGEQTLVRKLKARHLKLQGVIGTGLFLSTGELKPPFDTDSSRANLIVGLLLGYAFVGSITYSVMISLGELVAFLPIQGGHITLAKRFVDAALSFTMGWNYWYNWTIVLPAEISAAAILINFWNKTVNNAVWMTIVLLVVVGINMCGAGAYGEAEFCSIKVLTITGLIIFGIIIDLGGGPNHDRIGFRYWKNPGPFVQYNDIPGALGRFLGWWAVMIQAAFSYIGTEIVAIAAGEAKNPRRNIPKAIRRVYIRILLFYVGGVIIIGLLVPSNDEHLDLADGTAASSPFVIAIERAGIKTLPSIINACLLTSAWSAGSSDLYTSSRALYGLAAAGNAPRIFLKTLPNGLPIASLLFCACFACLAYMGVGDGSGEVFGWFSSMTSVAGLLTWAGISLTYIRFHAALKAQGYDRKELPYTAPLQPFAAWYALVFCILIVFFNGFAVFLKGNFDVATLITSYLPFILFPILYLSAKIYYWRHGQPFAWTAPEQLDLVSNLDQIEADSYDDPPPKNKLEAFWAWLM
ncbi:Amino acid permease [Mycena kentingensis (nom. inval.)]|nr:Amino acid permease [Mycena kentingensis (nom. inval.)]